MIAKPLTILTACLLAAGSACADCTLINADQQKTEQLTVQEWSLDGAFSATKADGQLVVMPTRSVFMLRQNRPEPAAAPSASGGQWQLLLRQGDTLIGWPRALKETSLEFETRSLGVVDVPLKSAALLVRQSAAGVVPPASAVRDILRLRNGDKVEGLIAALSAKSVQVQSDLGLTTIDLETVDRVIFAGVPIPASDQLMARVYLADGSRITTTKLKWLLNEITFSDPAGTGRRMPADAVTGVDILGGQACSLTDLVPVENVHQPYLGPTRLARMNRNAAGGPLIVHGVTYERGIGTQAASKVKYQINGAFSQFTFGVGMDDSAEMMGRASVSVWADGKRIFQQSNLAAGRPPIDATLNISNVNTLEIHSDYVRDIDVQARVNWINPVLRR